MQITCLCRFRGETGALCIHLHCALHSVFHPRLQKKNLPSKKKVQLQHRQLQMFQMQHMALLPPPGQRPQEHREPGPCPTTIPGLGLVPWLQLQT